MADLKCIHEILAEGTFDRLMGIAEDEQLDFKRSPYQLAEDRQKMELAKDISALANAGGGLILIGIETRQDAERQLEEAVQIRFFRSSTSTQPAWATYWNPGSTLRFVA